MKRKLIGFAGCMICAWSGLVTTIFAFVEETPSKQGWLSIGAAVLFVAALAFAGYGSSKKDNRCR